MNPALPRTMSLGPVEHPDLTGLLIMKVLKLGSVTKVYLKSRIPGEYVLKVGK